MSATAPRAAAWAAPASLPVARVPPEARGLRRDEVRLLVADARGVVHARFRDLPRFVRAGDLLIVNTSATLAAAVEAVRPRGEPVTVHFSTRLDPVSDGGRGATPDRELWAVEVRPRGAATGPVEDAIAGERLSLPGGAGLVLVAPYAGSADGGTRLWRAALTGARARALFRGHGRPIAYAYVEGAWPLPAYRTVFARHAGSAEMPSAGRPFSHRLLATLVARGVALAPITLHAGVSSFDAGEPPLPERFRLPASTAARVNATRARGGRVIAVGTTAARALETAADPAGSVAPARGWTELVLGPERPARVVDGLITGWHAPGASHLRLLEAVAGVPLVRRAYAEALAAGYLWHEFGDSCLLLPERVDSGA